MSKKFELSIGMSPRHKKWGTHLVTLSLSRYTFLLVPWPISQQLWSEVPARCRTDSTILTIAFLISLDSLINVVIFLCGDIHVQLNDNKIFPLLQLHIFVFYILQLFYTLFNIFITFQWTRDNKVTFHPSIGSNPGPCCGHAKRVYHVSTWTARLAK